MNKINFITIVFLIIFCTKINAQGLSGFIQNDNNEPIPFSSVFIKQLGTGTSSDANGQYFINLPNGIYDVIFSSIGYTTESFEVIIGDKDIEQKNVWLKVSNKELDEVIVSATRKDPAYEIIQKVIANKKKYLSQLSSSRSHIYVKATEIVNQKAKQSKIISELAEDEPFGDLFANEKRKNENVSMIEMDIVLNYQYPNNYKEERTAVKSFGKKMGLYIPRFDESDFNFYRNIIELKGLTEAPIISPISRTSILSYKYKLENIDTINRKVVYKIKVIPRKSGNSTCKGYLYINDSIWNINKLDLSFNKGGLRFYDEFRLKQNYLQINDTLWLPDRQEFIYKTKQGKSKTFEGNTVMHHSDFQVNYSFSENFFNNEIAITKKEAYKKDSSYWNSSRPEPLTHVEQKMVLYRDSIHDAQNTTHYKDSIETKFNKVSVGEFLLHDMGFRDHRKKRQYTISSILNTTGFEVIGGYRVVPYLNYFKKWENGQFIWTRGALSLGVQNKDLQGSGNIWYLYNPMRNASIRVSLARRFESINPNDAYLNQLKRSNYFLNDRLIVNHRTEIFNGFYFRAGFNYANRQSVNNLNSKTIIGDIIEDEIPLDFADYTALVTQLRFSYTPKQRFMTEPTRKVVLGSDFPTFIINYDKGWNGPFTSSIDFDKIEFRIRQKMTIGMLGNSQYEMQVGKFVNTQNLRFIDQKRFRQSDPYLYSDPLTSFQLLDTALVATQPYFEVHHIHHFNGALVNNIPLIKKIRLRVVAGAGFLWVKESNYRHTEFFAGMERVFKFGARRRLRIGIYGVGAQSNQARPKTDFKISFDIIDTWKRDWSY